MPRIKVGVLKSFEYFIASSHAIKDLPFGHKTQKLPSSEIISTQTALKHLAPATIVYTIVFLVLCS